MEKKNFGYQILPDRQYDYDKADLSIKEYIELQEPTFTSCIICGTCSGTCSAAAYSKMKPHKINLYIRRGMENEIADIIGDCVLCGKCQLLCPRNVNTRNVYWHLKQKFSK